jgi:ribosomal protein S12 methylthiotransferase accessory factor
VEGATIVETHWAESRYTGLFTRVGPVPSRPHDPDVAIWGALLAPWGPRPEPIGVGGAGWDPSAARDATLGESVERWQPCALPADRFVEASFDAWPLDEPAVAPSRWILFAPDQYDQPGFPFRPLTSRTVCRWVCCRTMPDGTPCWVPEDFAFLFARTGTAHTFGASISTGLSSGRPGHPVLLRGVQEVIERDALMGAWWGRYRLCDWEPGRVLEALDSSLRNRLLRPNLRYRFYRVDSPYSAHATIVTIEGDDHEGFCFSTGSACRETRAASWEKSLLEAVQGRHYVRRLKAAIAGVSAEVGEGTSARHVDSTPTNFGEHAVYYSLHPERLAETVFRRADPSENDEPINGPEDLARLIERLGPGHPVLFRNLTPPAVAQGPRDGYVLRVLVPGLQPMHGDHRLPFLGGPLWHPRTAADWSSWPPHPFA